MTTPAGTPDPRRWWALAALCLAIFLVAVDGTVLSLATPSIVRDLHPTATQILWIGDIYSFVLAGLLVTMGNIGDRVGRKKLLLIGGTLFALISIPAAFSGTPEVLIAMRALLGVAGATLMPSTLALMRSTFADPRERSFAVGVWSAMGAAGAAAGPLVGGILLEHFWWGSVFLLNVPIMALVVIIGYPTLRESKDPAPGPLDALSVVMSLVGILATVFAVKEIATHGWAPSTGLLGIAGVVVLYLFIRRQMVLEHPLIDVRLFTSWSFTGAVLGMVLSVFGLAGSLFFFSQYLQFVKGLSPLEAGVFELPATIAALLMSLLAARLMHRFGRGPLTGLGLIVMAGGMVAIAFALDSPQFLIFAVPLAMIGGGDGVALAVASDTILAVAPKDRAGAASAVSETGYELGTALGIAFLGSILTAVYQSDLDLPTGLDGATVQVAQESPGGAFEVAPGLAEALRTALLDAGAEIEAKERDREAAQVAFTDALRVTTLVGAGIILVGAVVTWYCLPGRLDPVEEMQVH